MARLVAAVWMAVPAFLAVMPALVGPTSARALSRSQALLDERDASGALLSAKGYVAAHPRDPAGRLALGRALLAAGDAPGAEAELKRALEYGGVENDIMPALAQALLVQERHGELIRRYATAVIADPATAAEVHTVVAASYLATDQTARARSTIERVLGDRPAHRPAQLLRAQIVAAAGDLTGAMMVVDDVVQAEPSNGQAWYLKAELLRRQGADPPVVVAAYRKALSVRSDLLPAHATLIALLLQHGDLAAAKQQLADMQRAFPNHPQSAYQDALVALQSGESARAHAICQALAGRAPDSVPVQRLAGVAALRAGAYAQAETALKKVAAADPKATAPRVWLAEAQWRSGRADHALATLEPLLQGAQAQADALMLAGQIELSQGQYARADDLLAAAARLERDGDAARTVRAVALLRGGQGERAIAELEAIISRDQGNDVAAMTLIAAKARRADYAGAHQALAAFAARHPQSPTPDFLRGQIAWSRGERAAARTAYEQALAKDRWHVPTIDALAEVDQAEGKPSEASKRYEALAAHDPRQVRAMLAIAALALRPGGGGPAQAKPWTERALRAGNGDHATRTAAIRLFLQAGDATAALQAAQAADDAMPQQPDVLALLGQAQVAAGEPRQAITTLSRAIALRPDSAETHLRLAEAYERASQPAQAEPHRRRAAELAPGLTQDQLGVVSAAMTDGRIDEALAVARALQQRRPQDAAGYRIEGNLLARSRQWDGAVAAFRKAVTRAKPADAPMRLHWALTLAGRTRDAAAFVQEWSRTHPADAGFHLYLAEAAMLGGDVDRAEAEYRRVVELRPDTSAALNALAYLAVQRGKPGAMELAQRAVALAPSNADNLDTLALVYAHEKQWDKAIEWQLKAVRLAPEKGGLRLQLARWYLQSGNKAKALEQLAELSRLGTAFTAHAEVEKLKKEAGG
ncbi:MAG: PEP-CTERM system TPR-repeat protein PrsT [Rubrivivax sp.]|nr:PEP-CTERM system TPR-repeat protein PrsT [Rubrivivax sp.]